MDVTDRWVFTLMYLLVLLGLITPTLSQWRHRDGTSKENKLESVATLDPGVQDRTYTLNQMYLTHSNGIR